MKVKVNRIPQAPKVTETEFLRVDRDMAVERARDAEAQVREARDEIRRLHQIIGELYATGKTVGMMLQFDDDDLPRPPR
jgi:hypothetical protein